MNKSQKLLGVLAIICWLGSATLAIAEQAGQCVDNPGTQLQVRVLGKCGALFKGGNQRHSIGKSDTGKDLRCSAKVVEWAYIASDALYSPIEDSVLAPVRIFTLNGLIRSAKSSDKSSSCKQLGQKSMSVAGPVTFKFSLIPGKLMQLIPTVEAADQREPVPSCINHCGDGFCAEIVCLSLNCPCAETARSCPQDCGTGAR